MRRRIPRGDRQADQICFRGEAATFDNSFEHGGLSLEHDFPRFYTPPETATGKALFSFALD